MPNQLEVFGAPDQSDRVGPVGSALMAMTRRSGLWLAATILAGPWIMGAPTRAQTATPLRIGVLSDLPLPA
jgi:hypothetical protein